MTAQEFFFDLPLYTKIKISENQVFHDLCRTVHVDGYNPIKGVDSTFCLNRHIDYSHVYGETTDLLRLDCQRYANSLYVLVHFCEEEDYIEKVGQYPSVADIHIAQIKRYRKVLGEAYIRDFTRAVGLAANGIGTGSFVYLRRVFEHLILEIADKSIQSGEIDKTQFETSKMDNRLKLLSSHLPDVVLENKPLYGVLSAGIHELSEEDCLNYFSIVRSVIELILDEMEHSRQMEEKKKNAKKELESIAGVVKQKVASSK